MNTLNKTDNNQKEHHGCVTAWLILLIVGNSIAALLILISVFFKNHYSNMPMPVQIIMALLAIANIVFVIQLFRWKMIGFIGYTATAVIAIVIHLFIGDSSITQLIYGVLSIAILYAILQIKNNKKSAWEELE
jgi:uncharacterized membrane protein YuzA (DUF378 family)